MVLTSGLQRPLSGQAQQSLRELAARLESCVETCLVVCAREFSETKTELAVRAAHLLREFFTVLADRPLRRHPSTLIRPSPYHLESSASRRDAFSLGQTRRQEYSRPMRLIMPL